MHQGRAHLTVRTNRFRAKDILGRTVIIHSHLDDFHTQPAGTKIACGEFAGGLYPAKRIMKKEASCCRMKEANYSRRLIV